MCWGVILMSFYGIVIAFTILLCAMQLSAVYAEAGALNQLNLQYASVSHIFNVMSRYINISIL